MSGCPFIALTLLAAGKQEPQPIFVNAAMIRSINPRWVRKAGHTGPYGHDDFDLIGTWVSIGDGEEGTFPVSEGYGEVSGAIRDVFK